MKGRLNNNGKLDVQSYYEVL